MSCSTGAAVMTTAPAAAVAAAGCDTGAPAAVEILVEGRPTDVEEVSGNDDEAAPMLTAAAADAASASASAAPFNKDYRLDFTDVEGNLEEIPEEGTARMAAAAGSGRKLEPAEIADLDGGNKDGGGGAVVESAEAASAPALVAAPTAHFHIPESNASDYAYSECSFQESRGHHGQQQPLTAKQQVALWLTRTSMSDLSSVPSLRSLVFGKHPKSEQHHSPYCGSSLGSAHARGHSTKPERCRVRRGCSGRAEIHRNFSTKSLIVNGNAAGGGGGSNGAGYAKARGGNDLVSPAPIRKCETVMAISANSALAASATSGGGLLPHNGHGCHGDHRSLRHPSSLSLFRRLASRRGGEEEMGKRGLHNGSASGLRTPQGTRSYFSGSGCESPFRGIRPVNRLRCSASSVVCSRCASVCVSYSNSRLTSRAPSQNSLLQMRRASTSTTLQDMSIAGDFHCKICLMDTQLKDMANLQQCGCMFCKECLVQYVTYEVMSSAYDISCPDPECEKQGVLHMSEIENLVGKELTDKHKMFRLNTEVALDANRAWCPAKDCGALCHVCDESGAADAAKAVKCQSCSKEFCSLCSGNWHPEKTCAQYGQGLVLKNTVVGGGGRLDAISPVGSEFLFTLNGGGANEGADIKPCPMCRVPIERDAGCAQMMCKRCKHVFCWFCRESLDDDFLLRHYDSGKCKGKLGHSRVSVLWHRAQVVGIFAGFGILLLAASPFLLLAAPCIFCCRCKILDKLEAEANSRGSGIARSQ